MARQLKVRTNTHSGHPFVDNKLKVKNVPLIGFEWEVSYNQDYLHPDEYDDDDECGFLDSFCSSNGFYWHFECGCVEFASPVGNSISVARRVAKDFAKFTKKHRKIFDPDNNRAFYNSGGIHVSVGYPDGLGNSIEERQRHFTKIKGMLNRESSKSFIWEFSGRKFSTNTHYSDQARTSNWDRDLANSQRTWGRVRQAASMLKLQNHRFEYRLWGNTGKFLIPAIEFAHSTFIFTRDRKTIPYLREYRDWLFKQKGYKALKNFEHAKWELLE